MKKIESQTRLRFAFELSPSAVDFSFFYQIQLLFWVRKGKRTGVPILYLN